MKKTLSYTITGILAASLFTACAAGNSTAVSSTLSSDGSNSYVSLTEVQAGTEAVQLSTAINAEQTEYISADNTAVSASGLKADVSDVFSKRDLKQTVDTSEATVIKIEDDKTYTISEEGIYVITGEAENCTIRVEADKEAKVQLVLDGVSITNDDFPAVYVVSADKCFITTTSSENTLIVTGNYIADGSTDTDAVIFSKDDLVLNGVGTLNIASYYGNGISGKDDVKVTGGTYNIKSAKDAIEANDSIAVYDGTINIASKKDGLHSENDEDSSTGYIYIQNGTITITAASDALQGTSFVRIDNGTLNLTASEGIEGTYVVINGGDIDISATDDGINASAKSSAYQVPTIEINGGNLTIAVGQGDTDGIDANGNIYVNGGTIDITAQMSSFDYDGKAEYNGGTIIINGSEVNSIPESMMGGHGGPMGGFGRQMDNRGRFGRT